MGPKSYECPNPKAPTAIAAANSPNETAVNHVQIGNDTCSDSDVDDDNSNLEFSFYTKDQDGKEQTPDTWVLLDISQQWMFSLMDLSWITSATQSLVLIFTAMQV